MTLRLRLLLATFVLSLTTTLVLAWGVRTAWRGAELERFDQEFHAATSELEEELSKAATEKQKLFEPLCAHEPLVDSALIGLSAGDLSSRLLPLRLRVPELQKALGLDELALIADDGEVLAGEVPTRPPGGEKALGALVQRRAKSPGLREDGEAAFAIACIKTSGGRWVGLLGAQHLAGYLTAARARYGLELGWQGPGEETAKRRDSLMQRALSSPALGKRVLLASRSRLALSDAVENLDLRVIVISLVALGVASIIAVWLSRGLAGPVVAFAERARAAVSGTPEPLPLSGGPELEQAARAFNQTLADLSALRVRLAITERIAARREVARQIAHEIRNPLSPIRSAIETLRRLKSRGAPEFEEYFDEATRTVLGEVARINDLVRSFSEYASLPSPRPSEFDLSALCRELVSLHQTPDVALLLDAPRPLPIVADRAQLTQVLTNLIKNGIEATSGITDAEVRVSVRATDPALVEVCVGDNGPGVSDELSTRLFEPYLTTKAGGTGLGLAISQRIAVEHGGDLRLLPRVGRGATFALSLPERGPTTSI